MKLSDFKSINKSPFESLTIISKSDIAMISPSKLISFILEKTRFLYAI